MSLDSWTVRTAHNLQHILNDGLFRRGLRQQASLTMATTASSKRRKRLHQHIILWHMQHTLSWYSLTYARHNHSLTYANSQQWYPLKSARSLLWLQICLYKIAQNLRLHVHRPWLLHHYDRLRLYQLIDNKSSQSVHVITIIQNTPAMTVGGNRGDKKWHNK